MSADSPVSSSPPPIRYFDLLPLELIRSIIEHLAPLDYNENTYQHRKRTLYSTCLVSRLLRKLAQPLLFSIVKVNGNLNLARLQRAIEMDGAHLGAPIRILIVSGTGWSSRNAGDEMVFADSTPMLEELRCELDSLHLESYYGTNLKKLHCRDLQLAGLPQLRFPQLEQLSFSYIDFPSSGLSSSLLPALSHFACYDDANYFHPYEISSFAALASHVTSMSYNLDLLEKLPSLLFDTPSLSLLFDCHLSDSNGFKLRTAKVKYLRIYDESSIGPCSGENYSVSEKAEMWRSWTTIFESKDTKISLQVLYLPASSLCEEEEGDSVSEGSYESVTALVRACQNRNIEVVFEDQPLPGALQSQLSDDFMRRSEARRKALEAGEKEEGK
ncbi:hypothetical protein JCM5353_007263 [Sporobolomyces roseus]